MTLRLPGPAVHRFRPVRDRGLTRYVAGMSATTSDTLRDRLAKLDDSGDAAARIRYFQPGADLPFFSTYVPRSQDGRPPVLTVPQAGDRIQVDKGLFVVRRRTFDQTTQETERTLLADDPSCSSSYQSLSSIIRIDLLCDLIDEDGNLVDDNGDLLYAPEPVTEKRPRRDVLARLRGR